ncbi:MAG: PKD domain-containing protein [Halorientalis sp.]
MNGQRVAVWALAAAFIVLGGVGALATPTSVAEFGDAHRGTTNWTAAQYASGGSTLLTAEAGGPYSVNESNTVTLDGTNSSTSTGTIQDYNWTIIDGPGRLQPPTSGKNVDTVTYEAPNNVASDTNVTVELTVTDNKGNTDSDTATITVNDTA